MPAPHQNPFADVTAGPAPHAAGPRAAETLLLLAHDESLTDALVSVVPDESLTVVRDEAALAQHLLSGHVGVVFVDAGASQSPGAAAQLTQRLHNQLPDVVLVVAGDGAAQNELASLVADGTIYRFVHKPVSPQRIKLFVDAAWRKRDGNGASGLYPALSMSPLPPAPPAAPARSLPWPALLAGALVIGAAGAWFALRPSSHPDTGSAAQAPAASLTPKLPPLAAPAATATDATAAPSAAAPRTVAAADLDRLATAAEQALLAGDLVEAQRLTDAARAVDPEHVRVKFLTAQLAREQAHAAARRHAAAQAAAEALAPVPLPDAAPARASAPEELLPVVAASVTTTTDATLAREPASSSPPSSTPPVSEARDPNSVAAVILQRVYSPDPEFPEIARERDLTGFVDLEFTVRADGTVTDVNVLRAQPKGVFEKAAVDAVGKWRYRPIERNGLPVNEHARLRLNFAYK